MAQTCSTKEIFLQRRRFTCTQVPMPVYHDQGRTPKLLQPRLQAKLLKCWGALAEIRQLWNAFQTNRHKWLTKFLVSFRNSLTAVSTRARLICIPWDDRAKNFKKISQEGIPARPCDNSAATIHFNISKFSWHWRTLTLWRLAKILKGKSRN